MNTHEKQIATYNEIEAIYERNNPAKEGKRADELVKQTGELIKKRLLEIAGTDKLLVAYMKQINRLGLGPQLNESSASYLMRMRDPGNYTWVRTFCKKNSIQKPEEFLRLANEHMRCQLTCYCEICESPELSEKIKLERGNYILQTYQNMLDLGGVEFTPEIEKMLTVIKRRVRELEKMKEDEVLYYWPLKGVPFIPVINRISKLGFLPETANARTVFSKFHNEHQIILSWNGQTRKLIYFLLLVYGKDGLNGESISQIAFKLFNWKGKGSKNAKSSFSTELNCVIAGLHDIHVYDKTYQDIYDIVKNRNLD